MSEVDSDSVDSSQAISPETPKYVPNTQEREDDDVPFVTSNHPFIAVSPIRPVETANNSVTKEITTKGPPPMDIDTFFAEVKQGNVEKVKGMVESARGYLYTTSKTNATPLTIAMKYNQEAMVMYLLHAGVDINERDKGGYTVLAYAISNKQNDLVQLLVNEGADIVTPGGPDRSALVLAAKNANIPLVKQFLKESGQNKGLAFLYAVQGTSETVVRTLVEQGGCDVNLKHKNGESALIVAASKVGCSNGILKYLIERGARVADGPANGHPTTLMCMCQHASPEIIQLAISHGASVNSVYKGGFTPLFFAVKGSSPSNAKDICRILVRAGANINHQNSAGVTPLIYAVQRREVLVIQELLNLGADPFISDQAERTAVDYAGDHDIVMDILHRAVFSTTVVEKNENANGGESSIVPIVGSSSSGGCAPIVDARVESQGNGYHYQDDHSYVLDDHCPVIGAPSAPSSPHKTHTRTNEGDLRFSVPIKDGSAKESRLPPAALSAMAKINQKITSSPPSFQPLSETNIGGNSLLVTGYTSKPTSTPTTAMPSTPNALAMKMRYDQLLHCFAYFQLWHCEHLLRQAKKFRDLIRIEELHKERTRFLSTYNLPLTWSTGVMARDPRIKPMLTNVAGGGGTGMGEHKIDEHSATATVFPVSIDWLLREANVLWDTLWVNDSIDHDEIALLLKMKGLKYEIEEVICSMVR